VAYVLEVAGLEQVSECAVSCRSGAKQFQKSLWRAHRAPNFLFSQILL